MKSKKVTYSPNNLKRAEHLYPDNNVPTRDLNPQNIFIQKDNKGNWCVKPK